MELKGKRIAFLGDSITQGVGASCPENVYWQVFGRNTGAIVSGNGIGGTRYAKQPGVTEFTWGEKYFELRVDELDPDADVIVVLGGVNDFVHGNAPLGKMSDRDPTTFYGAVHSLCLKLLERYPTSEIVLMTPLHCGNEEVYTNYHETHIRMVASLGGYAQAIREVAEYYGLPVLDLFRTSGLNPEVPIIREMYMPDGLHPNDAGYARMAKRLEGFLRTL
ncbi:MAG: SGNH/GDSL hydrolase family protein [Clostridia bacterium]|nr:SGNH/GDSL hydrolase family protein [Clostridia bacterium]